MAKSKNPKTLAAAASLAVAAGALPSAAPAQAVQGAENVPQGAEAILNAAAATATPGAQPQTADVPSEYLPEQTKDEATRLRCGSIEHARSLPETDDQAAEPLLAFVASDIEVFKGEDRRTMQVVVVDGTLAQRELVRKAVVGGAE